MSIKDNILNYYQSNPKEFHRFAKFSLVGALGAVLDFALLNLMRGVFGWPLLWANTLSVSAAILNNFFWNRRWTFPESQERNHTTQLLQFATVNLIGLVINNLVVISVDAVLVPLMGEPWSYNLAKLLAIGIVLFWNFGINRLWTYRGL